MANSSRLQDVARTLTGVALVAREAASSSRSLELLRSGDFSAFASSALSRAFLSFSDFAGLTRGSPQSPPDLTFYRHSPGTTPDDSHPSPEIPTRRDSASFQAALPPQIPPQAPPATSDDLVAAQVSSAHPQRATSANSEESVLLQKNGNGVHKLAASSSVGLADSEEENTQKVLEGNRPRDLNSSAVPQSSRRRRPRERRVPATPLGRAFGFASLGAGIALGTLQESVKRIWGGQQNSENQGFALSPFMTEQNAERLAIGLCRMRGAALKLGQMLSIQDESLLPPQVLAALETVRQGADVMPKRQLNRVITSELGPDWRSKLASFDDEPIAAASIGQVHKAVLKDGTEVAMKIQYPGVAQSINSDIENVRRLLEFTNVIPKGLYLEQAMKVAKEELARECDYMLEAASQTRFRDLLQKEKGVYVPKVVSDFSSKRVLTTELVPGVSIDKVSKMNQTIRNSVAKRLLRLTLQELFVHRFMQTDPNWSNFLYDESTDTINLIDFGAAREYPKHFVDDYLKMVYACANQDRKNVIEMSCKLGFLTGEESTVMLDAHCEAAFMVGLPFSREGGFDFHGSNLTRRVSELGAVMLRHRLTAPPEEAYSLHRKLSGAFLACIKLQAVVPCREMFLEVFNEYDFSRS